MPWGLQGFVEESSLLRGSPDLVNGYFVDFIRIIIPNSDPC